MGSVPKTHNEKFFYGTATKIRDKQYYNPP